MADALDLDAEAGLLVLVAADKVPDSDADPVTDVTDCAEVVLDRSWQAATATASLMAFERTILSVWY